MWPVTFCTFTIEKADFDCVINVEEFYLDRTRSNYLTKGMQKKQIIISS